ncbi:MAG: vWA domain-containing protein [Candidatus Paceibacterota bacterium]|jgi:uncharacterized protein with von Willebrand factor type A (vWA) domain
MKVFSKILLAFGIITIVAGCDVSQQGTDLRASGSSTPAAKAPSAWFGATDTVALKLDSSLMRKNYYIILDGSSSMEGRAGGDVKIVAAKDAISRFAKSIPPDANLGLFVFNDAGVSERVPLGTGNRPRFMSALGTVSAGGGTPLRSAITNAYERIRAQAQRQLGYGEYHLVIVTDGEANFGEDPRDIVDKIVSESPVVLHTIGFGIDEGHSLNQKGKVFYKSAADKAALQKGLADVVAESDKF